MEQAILALLGVSITLTFYLDRGRRADLAQLRAETRADFAQLREETRADFAQLREETRADFAQLREETRAGFAQLTEIVLDLCRRVGQLEGRTEARESPAQPSP